MKVAKSKLKYNYLENNITRRRGNHVICHSQDYSPIIVLICHSQDYSPIQVVSEKIYILDGNVMKKFKMLKSQPVVLADHIKDICM